jgi:hypothetical protein
MSSEDQRTYRHRITEAVQVDAAPSALFDHLDDHESLASHMMQSSSMMAGGAMSFTFDEGRGRTLGSRIGMTGKFLGIALEVSEVVTERAPPYRKAWETTGRPRLLVIGAYRMGFEIEAAGTGSRLTVFIDYDLPPWPSRMLGLIAGRFYARWCVESMANDAVRDFAA